MIETTDSTNFIRSSSFEDGCQRATQLRANSSNTLSSWEVNALGWRDTWEAWHSLHLEMEIIPLKNSRIIDQEPQRNTGTCLLSPAGGLAAKLYPTLVTLQTAVCQSPLSMEFPRQQYWSRLPLPSLRDIPDPGIKPRCPTLQWILYWLSH